MPVYGIYPVMAYPLCVACYNPVRLALRPVVGVKALSAFSPSLRAGDRIVSDGFSCCCRPARLNVPPTPAATGEDPLCVALSAITVRGFAYWVSEGMSAFTARPEDRRHILKVKV